MNREVLHRLRLFISAAAAGVALLACGTASDSPAPDDGSGGAATTDPGQGGGSVVDPGDEDPGDPDDGDPGEVIDPQEPPAPPEDPGDAGPDASVFTVASWNANYNNAVGNVIQHIKTIDADILGLQEMGAPKRAASIIAGVTDCKGCEYAAYHPQKDNAHACPIIWKKAKFKRINAGSFKVNDAKYINDGGSRENLLKKSTVWVQLEEIKTGARFYLSNNHLVPSVELDGKPYPGRQERLAMFDRHMDGIVDTIKKAKSQGLPIFVTGDFNVNFRKDRKEQAPIFPYARFKAHNVFANWHYLGAGTEGTHHSGSRLIDYVHVSKTPKVEPLSHAILGKGGSDHKAVRMKVRIKR